MPKDAVFINGDGTKTTVIDVPLDELPEFIERLQREYGDKGVQAFLDELNPNFVRPSNGD